MSGAAELNYEEIIETNGVKIPFVPEVITPKIERPMRNNRYGGGECKALKELLQPGDRVLELGAGVGLMSTVAALSEGVEKVVAVEANPSLIPFISKTYELNGATEVTLINGAISPSRSDAIDFYLRSDFWASSMEGGPRSYVRKVEVPGLSIHDLIAEHDPTVIVCDIEGGELGLFDEADLKNVRLVVMELHPKVYGLEQEQSICDGLEGHGLGPVPEKKRTTVRRFMRPEAPLIAAAVALNDEDFTDANGNACRANGMGYRKFLQEMHQSLMFDWYMEVGCRSGKSFADVRSKTIAVDPVFSIRHNVVGVKPELYLFQKPSDDFFGSKFLEKNEIEISVAFLDGMHLFEYLLRDFIGTERNASKNGVILLHDCCPWNNTMTTRDLDNIPDGPWTGDVWKLIPILNKYRPDLKIDVLDCKPTGLVAISNLDPDNTVLSDAYDEIEAEFLDLDLGLSKAREFYESFDFVSAEEERAAGYPLFTGVQIKDEIGLNKKITP